VSQQDASSLVIVVAEDNDDARDLFITTLELAGFIAHGVATLAAARELLAVVGADVLIADYSLPDGTGAELVKACSVARPKVCILLTGFDAEHVDVTGFHVVLKKPVVGRALIDAIRSHV
jgi:DNA-binding response OmpR family regulator